MLMFLFEFPHNPSMILYILFNIEVSIVYEFGIGEKSIDPLYRKGSSRKRQPVKGSHGLRRAYITRHLLPEVRNITGRCMGFDLDRVSR
jgi:hypothetical protein